jgi:hypothetical protein
MKERTDERIGHRLAAISSTVHANAGKMERS